MIIRQAKADDWKNIQDLNRQIFEHELQFEPSSNLDFPYADEAVKYFKRASEALDDHIAFVCEKDGDIVGYVIVKLVPQKEISHRVDVKLAQLHTLGVDKRYRGQGIGTKLIVAGREWAAKRGANKIKIVAYAGNDAARKLYHKMGFSEFAIEHEMDIIKS